MYVRRWPWVAQQEWRDVLFMHWPVPYELLKPYIPDPFILETYEGQAWVSIVLFRTEKSRLRSMPTIMSYPSFVQMNIRTYIQFNGEPGIYFLSVDVNRMLAMITAKRLLQLPFEMAEMKLKQMPDHLLFTSKRKQNHSEAQISVRYRSLANTVFNDKGTLTHWLTERYCFWMVYGTKIVKGPLSHMSWTLYHSEIEMATTNILPFIPKKYLYLNPLAYYAKSMHAYVHPFERIGIYKRTI